MSTREIAFAAGNADAAWLFWFFLYTVPTVALLFSALRYFKR